MTTSVRRDVRSLERVFYSNIPLRFAPQPPREIAVSNGLLTWKSPQDQRGITHYNIYAESELNLVRRVAAGQRQMQDNLQADRVWISSYNAYADAESTKILLDRSVAPPSTPGAEQKPGPVTGLAGKLERRLHNGELVDFVILTFGIPASGDFDGIEVLMEDPAIDTTATVSSGQTVATGSTVGTAGNIDTAQSVYKNSYTEGRPLQLGPWKIPAAGVQRRFYVNAYSAEAGAEPFVRAGQTGATPSVLITFPALTEKGGKGVEYCSNPINPVASVVYPTGGVVETYGYSLGVQAPADPRYSCFVVREKDATGAVLVVASGERTQINVGYWPIGQGKTVDLYFCGAARDAQGNLLINDISEGVTPKLTVTITPSVAGGVRTSELRDIPVAALATSIAAPVWVAGSVVPTTYQGDQIVLDGTRRLYIWNGAAYVRPMGGDGVKLELQGDKLTFAEIASGALRTYHFAGQEVLVGPSSGAADKPIRFAVKDLANTLLVFMGDDQTIPFTGLFARNARFAPTPSTVSPRIDISGSGIDMIDVSLYYNNNGTITEITDLSSGGGYVGMRVKDQVDANWKSEISKGSFSAYYGSGGSPFVAASLATDPASGGTLDLYGIGQFSPYLKAFRSGGLGYLDLAQGGEYRISGQAVLKARYSPRPTNTTEIINALVYHGITV